MNEGHPYDIINDIRSTMFLNVLKEILSGVVDLKGKSTTSSSVNLESCC